MAVEFIQKKKGAVELEFDDRALPNALSSVLSDKGIDAYVSEEHPLVPKYRLNIGAPDALKELKSALNLVEKKWKEFGESLGKDLK